MRFRVFSDYDTSRVRFVSQSYNSSIYATFNFSFIIYVYRGIANFPPIPLPFSHPTGNYVIHYVIDYLPNFIPNSLSCFSEISDGAFIIRSLPSPVLGKAMTSRMEGSFSRIIIKRSNPQAMPPCGGEPDARAWSIWLKFFSILSGA